MAALTIGSLNLHCGLSAAGRPFDVPSALASLEADLIAVQEAWWTDSDAGAPGRPDPGITDDVAVAADKLGAEFIRAPLAADASLAELAIAPRPDRGSWGIGVLSRLPVISHECISLGQAPGDPVGRAALVCTIQTPGGWPLRLVCTHLTHRFTSPAQLYKLTNHLDSPGAALRRPGRSGGAPGAVWTEERGTSDEGRRRHQGRPAGERKALPTVIAGDLNMPRLVTWIAAGYAPTVRGRTFPADRPLIQLDHLLVTPDLVVTGAAVLGPLGSDHLPVRARVDLA